MLNRAFENLKNLSRRRLVWMGVAASEMLTAIIVSVMSFIFHGMIRADFMITGAVTALITSSIVIYFGLYLIERLRKTEKLASHTIEELKDVRQQLIHANRLSSIGEMSAGVAHEIRQPLNIIRLTAQSLAMNAADGLIPPLGDHVAGGLKRIDSQVERINDITSHLLSFLRKDLMEDMQPVDVNLPIKDIFMLIEEELRLQDITVLKELSPSPLMVLASRSRLEQVLLNLITNAKDSMEDIPDAAKKTLSISSRLNDNGKIEVRISDTGRGIPKEIRDRVFEPFFTTKQTGKGTGLGLSISSGIVKEFGGDIGFAINDDAGTSFILTFPQAA
jgi:histidine kinase